jgi:CheY-like chemotaxis protein
MVLSRKHCLRLPLWRFPLARVLIVDDDEVVRLLMTALLEGMHHEPVAVQNGVDALRSHSERPADLVITDIYMPDMDGLELIRKINTAKSVPPIIAMSGSASDRRMDALPTAEHFGASAILYKPVDVAALKATVTRLLGEMA